MKHILILLSLVILILPANAQLHLNVSLLDLGQRVVARRAVLLTPIAPYPRTQGNNLFTRDSLSRFTDTAGLCTFSNVMWGTYRLDVFGVPAASYSLSIGTNLSGLVSAAAVVTNPQTLPPNPATNYYTMAQIDALLALVDGGGTATNLTPTDIAGKEWTFDGITLLSTTKSDNNPVSRIYDWTAITNTAFAVHEHSGQFVVGDIWDNFYTNFGFNIYSILPPFSVKLRGTNAFWVDGSGVMHGNGAGINNVAGLASGSINAADTILSLGSMYIGSVPPGGGTTYNGLHHYQSGNNTPALEWVKWWNGSVPIWEIETANFSYDGQPTDLAAFAWRVPIKLDGSDRQLIFGATNSPPATNTPVVWVAVEVGGQSYRLPLYQ